MNGDEDILLADGFDEAIIGYGQRVGEPQIAVYDAKKCIKILMERDGMTEEDAIDFFGFNVSGAWLGKGTPIFIYFPD